MVSLKRKSSGKKRKSSSSLSSSSARPAKSARYVDVPSSRLPWKRSAGVGYDFDGFEGGEGGMLELEEIDGVDIVYDHDGTDGSRRISFKVREDQLAATAGTQEEDDDDDVPFDPSDAFEGDPDAPREGDEEEEWTGFSAVDEEQQPDAETAAGQGATLVEETVQDSEASTPEEVALVASTSKAKGKGKAKSTVIAPVQQANAYDTPFDDALLPGFQQIHLLPSLKRALLSIGFQKPSAIQDQALSTVLVDPSYAVQSRDLIGVAETGSGKTLAYSLPILQEILVTASKAASATDCTERQKRPLSGLILCPTRELALQVRQHVGDVVYKASIPPGSDDESAAANDKGKTKYTPRVNIITICGGMSIQKQKRLLSSSYGVDIIVATPGRLWEMLQDDPELSKQVKGIKFLVLDEADRMIENGHFAELESIVNLTRRPASKSGSSGGGKGKKSKGKGKAQEQDDNARAAALESGTFEDDFSDPEDSLAAFPVREEMNTYVFSATMSKELQRNVKRKPKAGSSSNRFALTAEEQGHLGALAGLLAKLDFRDADPHLIDLTNEGGTVKQLQEVRVDCLLNEKDVYLYYFILRYPGRTLVFFSSIDAIRRLQPLLLLLELNVAVLHSGMQQRARLKALDRFKSSDNMVMLATDVAARGLDVPAVDHVVHYQLPRTADTYIHRSGRTARAGNEGLALQLCAPEEKPTQKALMTSLARTEKIKDLPVDFGLMSRLKDRVELARGIEVAAHRANKAAHDDAWLQKAADDMEIDLDADGSDSDHGRGMRKQKSKAAKGKEKDLRAQLKALLAQPVMLRGLSARYLTSGASAKFASDMLKGTSHGSLLGLSKTRAVEDMRASA